MDSSRDSEFDSRLARIEAAIAALERSVNTLIAERPPATTRQRTAEQPQPPLTRQRVPPEIRPTSHSWFASRSPEWWLSRVGIGFVVLAVLLLYGYAVDRGWLTPPVRVIMGAIVGALLLVAGIRVTSRSETDEKADLGFRELLFGAALAIWYVTAYAAAVWYHLIPIHIARLVFFLLGIASAWIALQERREIFALVAVATGFATPFILPAPVQSMTELSLYLGAVTVMGLTIYLMRGWQSIVLITFAALWISVGQQATTLSATTPTVLDSFDSVNPWTTTAAAGIEASIHPEATGTNGRAMRLDFDFHGRPGYAIVHRPLNMSLPDEYTFSFAIRGEAPPNTLEFKLIDPGGANVWWSNNPYFVFPRQWVTITRPKASIYFAWGPTRNRELKQVSAIEFAVSAGSGGKGSVWIDNLVFTQFIAHGVRSIALSILLLLAGAAFTRTPVLRRKLLALGSPRYTSPPVTPRTRGMMQQVDALSAVLGGGKSARDSISLWILALTSSVLAILLLARLWPQVQDEIWGAGFLALGIAALALFRRGGQPDAEVAHVTLTAGVLWTLMGIALLLPMPETVLACAVVSAFVIHTVERRYAGPRTVAKLAIAVALVFLTDHPSWLTESILVRLRWLASSVVSLGATAWVVRRLVTDPAEEKQGIVLAGIGYLTALVVIARGLGPIWEPLVTTTYALLGAVLLILSRREGARPVLRYLGGATMIIVVGRLLIIDLAAVETIWRVLLFMVIGAVFLYTARRMQPKRGAS